MVFYNAVSLVMIYALYNVERHILNNPTDTEEALSETNTDAVYNFYRAARLAHIL